MRLAGLQTDAGQVKVRLCTYAAHCRLSPGHLRLRTGTSLRAGYRRAEPFSSTCHLKRSRCLCLNIQARRTCQLLPFLSSRSSMSARPPRLLSRRLTTTTLQRDTRNTDQITLCSSGISLPLWELSLPMVTQTGKDLSTGWKSQTPWHGTLPV